jgi:hypothetical protein
MMSTDADADVSGRLGLGCLDLVGAPSAGFPLTKQARRLNQDHSGHIARAGEVGGGVGRGADRSKSPMMERTESRGSQTGLAIEE